MKIFLVPLKICSMPLIPFRVYLIDFRRGLARHEHLLYSKPREKCHACTLPVVTSHRTRGDKLHPLQCILDCVVTSKGQHLCHSGLDCVVVFNKPVVSYLIVFCPSVPGHLLPLFCFPPRCSFLKLKMSPQTHPPKYRYCLICFCILYLSLPATHIDIQPLLRALVLQGGRIISPAGAREQLEMGIYAKMCLSCSLGELPVLGHLRYHFHAGAFGRIVMDP